MQVVHFNFIFTWVHNLTTSESKDYSTGSMIQNGFDVSNSIKKKKVHGNKSLCQ